jgi:signal transduction histidine kinase
MEAIGHLTGGIAHDFNNILTSIMGYIVLAAERETALADAKLGKYLEQARLASTRARDLIQQMLTFSRGQRGEPRPLSLPPLIRAAVKLLRSTLPSTVEIETELSADAPAVLLDPVQLEQVLLNLCINARDAMHGTGTIRIGVRVLEALDCTCASCRQHVQERNLVELEVRDTGSGIRPEVLAHVRAVLSTKEVGKGSGMGLASVRHRPRVRRHIAVDTARRRGRIHPAPLPWRETSLGQRAGARGRAHAERAATGGPGAGREDESAWWRSSWASCSRPGGSRSRSRPVRSRRASWWLAIPRPSTS